MSNAKKRKIVVSRVLAKLCERKSDACVLVHEWADENYKSEEEFWEKVREVMCPGKDDGACDMEFGKLKEEVIKDDEVMSE